jgi:hypothetical protein
MKKTVLFLFAICICNIACKKKTSCTCRDHTGKITYNEVNETRSKLEKEHFEEDCLKKQSKTYTIGSGTTTTSYSTTCELS